VIGKTSSRSATFVAISAAGSVSGSARLPTMADAHRPSATAKAASGASSGMAVAGGEIGRGAGHQEDRDRAFETRHQKTGETPNENSRPSAVADEDAEHGQREGHCHVEYLEHSEWDHAQPTRSEERSEGKEDDRRCQRRREAQRRPAS
jgi:hypothetical protein